MKRAVQSAIRVGALGIRINCSGDLVELKWQEWNGIGKEGFLCILWRANIDYGVSRANTTTYTLFVV